MQQGPREEARKPPARQYEVASEQPQPADDWKDEAPRHRCIRGNGDRTEQARDEYRDRYEHPSEAQAIPDSNSIIPRPDLDDACRDRHQDVPVRDQPEGGASELKSIAFASERSGPGPCERPLETRDGLIHCKPRNCYDAGKRDRKWHPGSEVYLRRRWRARRCAQ